MNAQTETEPRRAYRSRKPMWLTLGLGTVAFMPFLLVFIQSAERERGALVLTEGDEAALRDGMRMLAPSFTGRTQSGEPYVVTADWALPDAPNPNMITLKGVEATLTMEDGRIATMASADGVFFPRIKRLRLENGVSATTSDGYRLDTDAATVDADGRNLKTDGIVRASGPVGSIRADQLEALDADDRIVKFLGNVRVTFDPEAAKNSPVNPK